jgi:hypothetical protein
MADTGSFPIAIPAKHDEARHLTLGFLAMFLLGAGTAAAGLHLEPQGYGALTLVGGGMLVGATAIPAWMLFRHPRVARKR